MAVAAEEAERGRLLAAAHLDRLQPAELGAEVDGAEVDGRLPGVAVVATQEGARQAVVLEPVRLKVLIGGACHDGIGVRQVGRIDGIGQAVGDELGVGAGDLGAEDDLRRARGVHLDGLGPEATVGEVDEALVARLGRHVLRAARARPRRLAAARARHEVGLRP